MLGNKPLSRRSVFKYFAKNESQIYFNTSNVESFSEKSRKSKQSLKPTKTGKKLLPVNRHQLKLPSSSTGWNRVANEQLSDYVIFYQ